MRTLSLFEDQRLTLEKAKELTAQSLNAYWSDYRHVAIAFSGGKDSTATVTMVLHLLEQGLITKPESLTVLYADTRQELPPLHTSAMAVLAEAERRGCKTKVVLPPMDKRFWVYILGRGVPSPNNGTLRWCTRQIKVDPMTAELEGLRSQLDPGERMLMLTGVRLGESAARDQRISVSCSRDGGECGQGWFQSMTAPQIDTLAPLLHWRVCHVWDWLSFEAPTLGFSTDLVAEVYGMSNLDGEEPLSTRTGCIGCPLTQEDAALDQLVKLPQWAYLEPLKDIKPIHREIRKFNNRLRKDGTETKKNGELVKNPGRVGPLTLEARERFLGQVLGIQAHINAAAIAQNRPQISLINAEEEARIRELIALRTFPDKWTGDEHRGDAMLPEVLADGSIQNLLFDLEVV
jgi:DNA sulfur modification protein DndC